MTGSVFRRKDLDTPSPVTVLTSTQMQQRGITTAADAVMSLAAAGGGGLPSSFSANGAFAAGATGVSLRGLTTDSTLVLQDGMRLADFPLADDGARSFVDLNTIPSAVIDRVEVLKDGASATYGADAIAGVVNYIMKKQITGISGTAEGGISQHKDDGHQRFTLTGGYGDLASQGFNFYVSGEYQHDAILYNRDRGFPYNTSNLSSKLADDGKSPDVNGNVNGGGFDVLSGATTSAVVVPATMATPGDVLSGQQISGTNPMILNPAGCGAGTNFSNAGGGTYCTQDITNQYRAIQPSQTRIGGTARLTVNVGDRAQAYIMGTYYQNREFIPSYGGPAGTSIINPISIQNLVLPAILANGSVNPQDPYANIIDPATGQRESALVKYAFGGIPNNETETSRTAHVAAGINGTFGDGWHYDVAGTYMHSQVDSTLRGNLNYAALINAVETGSYNFIDPSQNSQAELNALAPNIHAKATSELWQIQGTITKSLYDLPGGPLQLAVSGQVHYEGINDPNEDPTGAGEAAGINSFNAAGHRYNESGAFELDAPILKQLDVNASGRYDHYSEGFSHFSPKVGVKITPVHSVILRGTFSKGFRAPSIPETQGSVLGFTTATPPASVIAEHGNNGYVQPYSLGLNTAGNPNLKPETSTSFTGGVVLEPTRWLSLSADYYRIKKNNVIVAGPLSGEAMDDYYNGTALPAGYSIVQNSVDPANPNATRTIEIINSPYENANSLVTSGLDLAASVNYRIAPNIRFFSSLDATWIQKYNIRTADGVQHFAGTVGPYDTTSASGTPRWRANWQNTLSVNKWTLTATAYYTSGYRGTADDYQTIEPGASACSAAIATTTDADGNSVSEQCHVKHFIDVDMVVSYAVTDKFSLFGDVYNVGNAKAPFDPNTYGGVNYNPAWSNAGVIGRYFKIGANFGF
ncbi:TonB-dependent receptor plug domain-containing protein [Sphingomonas abietis]|uniref:TonB-dependent receptor n=1 Tax=Sphingomonas abietis TaxID=3012344 RepID=A0ABY7NWQ8_9SPHN|nr:TonB-dependent receptor [Sphingomonas abietis]WBO23841.1 TonB-dependent receptor [Sphingomonas abietis]